MSKETNHKKNEFEAKLKGNRYCRLHGEMHKYQSCTCDITASTIRIGQRFGGEVTGMSNVVGHDK